MGLWDNDYTHRHSDEKVTVTLKATRGQSTDSDTISYASRLATTRVRQLFGPVSLEGDSKTWVIPNAELNNVSEIRSGDRIVESDDTGWRVDQVTRDTPETQWICLCTKER